MPLTLSRSYRLLIAAALLAGVWSAPSIGASPPPAAADLRANVSGVVGDQATGRPVPGAGVSLAGYELSSLVDAEGRFGWQSIPVPEPEWPVTITVTAAGYGAWTLQGVRLRANDTLILTVDLGAEPKTVVAPVPRADQSEWPELPFELPDPAALSAASTHWAAPASIRVRVTGWGHCDLKRPYSVQVIDFRTYLKHVLPNEWGARWHAESLRAGAMAAKMYAWYWVSRGGKWPDADVYDSTCDQVYNPNIAYASTNAAVDDTWPWRLLRNNAFFPTYYRAYYSQCEQAGLAGRCMGQWDSKWMADAGSLWTQILPSFYHGSEISLIPPTVQVPEPPAPPPASNFALRFFGNGAADVDRLKIPVDDPTSAVEPPRPADVGAADFTIEWWLKANPGDNPAPAVACGANTNWRNGHVVLDRDRFNAGRKFGVSLAGGAVVFGVTGLVTDSLTLCGSTAVDDGDWHHVAVARRRADGFLWLWVDGRLEAAADGPDGDVSYPDDAVPGQFCQNGTQACALSDPFLVFGAEKHDAAPGSRAFSGWLDEARFSDVLRYTAPFSPSGRFAMDLNTLALFHFDDPAAPGPCSGYVRDSSTLAGGPSHGACHHGAAGGSPGPLWVASDAPAGLQRLFIPLLVK